MLRLSKADRILDRVLPLVDASTERSRSATCGNNRLASLSSSPTEEGIPREDQSHLEPDWSSKRTTVFGGALHSPFSRVDISFLNQIPFLLGGVPLFCQHTTFWGYPLSWTQSSGGFRPPWLDRTHPYSRPSQKGGMSRKDRGTLSAFPPFSARPMVCLAPYGGALAASVTRPARFCWARKGNVGPEYICRSPLCSSDEVRSTDCTMVSGARVGTGCASEYTGFVLLCDNCPPPSVFPRFSRTPALAGAG